MKKKFKNRIILIFQVLLILFYANALVMTPIIKGNSTALSSLRRASWDYSNVTCVSDGFNGYYWNDLVSTHPSIAIDNQGNIHVIWEDRDYGPWGGGSTDTEILHALYDINTNQWSNVSCVSDPVDGEDWNIDLSDEPSIAVDSQGNAHAVWKDYTDGPWGDDIDILHSFYNKTTGKWSNATCVSDSVDWVDWNVGNSMYPSIAVDSNDNAHVVWSDYTNGPWGSGSDLEILHSIYNSTLRQWSNATCVSDPVDWVNWNTGSSSSPSIAIDSNDNAHVVWGDLTNGPWGSDWDILHSYFNPTTKQWSNATCVSDPIDWVDWNVGNSLGASITMDSNGNGHVTWTENTDGPWGTDKEILYSSYNAITKQWTNASCISDGFGGTNWNDADSGYSSIAVDSNDNVFVVWVDATNGPWGDGSLETEILFATLNSVSDQWSNATCISDPVPWINWNSGDSSFPSIAVDGNDKIHVVWSDETPGPWGTDSDILHAVITFNDSSTNNPSNIPFGDFYALFMVIGIISLIFFIKRKKDLRTNL
jgi:hypothetical protein